MPDQPDTAPVAVAAVTLGECRRLVPGALVWLLAGCARGDEEVRLQGRWDTDVFRGGYDPEAGRNAHQADRPMLIPVPSFWLS